MGLTLTQNLPASARHGWTVAEFERLFEAGFFAPDAKYELIEGEVWEKMTQKTPHAVAVTLAQSLLADAFGVGFVVRVQLPLVFGQNSKPEPDVAIVSGLPRDYLENHPSTAALIVEISDTTLIPDQQTKAALYARAGVAEYWIVNLNERTLEVRRQSAPMSEAILGFGYRSTQILLRGESVSPLAAPDATIGIEELLP